MSPLAAIGIAAFMIIEGLFCWACCHVGARADLRAELIDSLRQNAAERPDVAMLVQRGSHSIHNEGNNA